MFLSTLNFNLGIICFSETCFSNSKVDNLKGWASTMFMKHVDCKDVNYKDIKSVGVELLYEKRRNTLSKIVHRLSKVKVEPFEKILENLFY